MHLNAPWITPVAWMAPAGSIGIVTPWISKSERELALSTTYGILEQPASLFPPEVVAARRGDSTVHVCRENDGGGCVALGQSRSLIPDYHVSKCQ